MSLTKNVDYYPGGLTRTAPAGISVADTHLTSSSLQHGLVTSSLSSELSSRTVPLARGTSHLTNSFSRNSH